MLLVGLLRLSLCQKGIFDVNEISHFRSFTRMEYKENFMSKERNKTKKRNRIKKQNSFFNSKASFVAGISVIAVCVNDVVGLIVDIPNWMSICEFFCILLIFYLALGTKKLDKMLASEGVDKFGAYLTIFSVIEFLLARILIGFAEGVKLSFTWRNGRLIAIIVLSVLSLMGICGSIYLLFYPYPKK